MTEYDFCDYCGAEMVGQAFIRIVGYTDLNGVQYPKCKFHCGTCPTPNDIDVKASADFKAAAVDK